MSGKNESFPVAGLLDTGTITSVLTALFFTAGVSYAYYYFSQFHIPVPGMDLPSGYFFFYGFKAVKNNLFAVFICIVATIAMYYFMRFLWQRAGEQTTDDTKHLPQKNKRALLLRASTFLGGLCYLLLLFLIFVCLGHRESTKDFSWEQENDFASYPRVRVWVNGEQDTYTERWASGCYRLLINTKTHLYLFPTDAGSKKLPTDIIPSGRVKAMELLPLYHSSPDCRESCIQDVPLS